MPDGQGHETTFAPVIADHLGVVIDDVIVRHGDTLGAPQAIGTFGSRSARLGGRARSPGPQRRSATRAGGWPRTY